MDTELLSFAKRFLRLRINIVPISGKKPVKGFDLEAAFKGKMPSEAQLEEYLEKASGFGVCGGVVSGGLAVLDFDLLERLREAFWDLSFLRETLIVQSLRGYHLYLLLPKRFWALAKGKMRGGDFIFNGAYAVGPGSRVGQTSYKIVSKTEEIIQLSEEEAEALLKWLGISPEEGHSSEKPSESHDLLQNFPEISEELIFIEYSRISAQRGRNNALFRLASYLRLRGVEITDSRVFGLISAHVKALAPEGHRFESPEAREIEAWRTVRSAYSYRRRAVSILIWTSLPNQVREALLNYRWLGSRSAILARLLDALLLSGIRENEELSYSQIARIAARARIGSRSLAEALIGKFSTIGSTYIWGFSPAHGDLVQSKSPIKPLFGEGDNWKVGQYRMPSMKDLALLLRVQLGSLSDKLEMADLQSSKLYRLALHRCFVGRLSPVVGLNFMASRLGVRGRSLRRYHVEMDLRRVVRESECLLNFQNVKLKLSELEVYRNRDGRRITPGAYLEIEGSRYPALAGVAFRHLKLGKEVKLVRELSSQYLLPEKDFGQERVQRLDESGLVLGTSLVKPLRQLEEERVEESSPQPLTLKDVKISGLAGWRVGVLTQAGVRTLQQLVVADAEFLARLPLGKYVRSRMIRFWQAQARALLQGALLDGWRYADWKLYQEELGLLVRIPQVKDRRLRGKRMRAMVSLFLEKGWLRYGDQYLPLWLQRGLRRVRRIVVAAAISESG